MLAYLARRLIFALFLVFAVSSASLVLVRLAPGDYASESLGIAAHAGTIAQTRHRYGLDRPFAEQYRDWFVHALRFDFGRSMAYDRPVGDLIPERAANTALLAIAALLAATLIGIPLGIVTGSRRGGVLTGVIRTASITLLSMPPLLTSLFLVFVAARRLPTAPTATAPFCIVVGCPNCLTAAWRDLWRTRPSLFDVGGWLGMLRQSRRSRFWRRPVRRLPRTARV
jgi:peptide/nickel transport system permease protein